MILINISHKFMLKISHTNNILLALGFLAEIKPKFGKNQHICFHGNHGSRVAVGDISIADS